MAFAASKQIKKDLSLDLPFLQFLKIKPWNSHLF